jgi:hypothetical protein
MIQMPAQQTLAQAAKATMELYTPVKSTTAQIAIATIAWIKGNLKVSKSKSDSRSGVKLKWPKGCFLMLTSLAGNSAWEFAMVALSLSIPVRATGDLPSLVQVGFKSGN